MAFPKSLFALVAFLFLSCSALAAEQEYSLDFVYVTPNTGHAAGGHYGLKLGNSLYHYQFFANGEFLLVRDSWAKFTLIYAELSNRPIRVASVAVGKEAFDKVSRQLAQTLVKQNLDLQQRDDLAKAKRLFADLREGQGALSIPAAGFFSSHPSQPPAATSGIAVGLRQKIYSDLGENAATGKIAQIEQDLAAHEKLQPSASWSLELQNMLQKKVALEAIEGDWGLSRQAVIAPLPHEPRPDRQTLRALESYRQDVYHSILRLMESGRSGDGEALLLQLARYHALTLSIESGSYYSLDPFPDDALVVELSGQILASDALQNLYHAQLIDRQNLLEQMKNSPHPELVLNRLEEVRGRMFELDKVFQGAKKIRYDRGKMVPATPGQVRYGTGFSAEVLKRAEENMTREVEQATREILADYSYNLLSRNCVTEMNRQINSSFGSRAVSESQLGGWVSPGEQFAFSPFMFHSLVEKNYRVGEKEEIPSRRLRQLQEQEIDSLLKWLRETNAVTSTLYTRRERDTAFLMFTDNNWPMRPLFGLINAGYGALYTLTGVATLPFDKGERIEQGAQGVFYSLPELIFINIRKGTYLAPDYSFLEESP